MTRVKVVTIVPFFDPKRHLPFHYISFTLFNSSFSVSLAHSLHRANCLFSEILCSCLDGLEKSGTQTTSHTSEMDPQQSDGVAPGKQIWSQDSRVKESITEWTDEKHRLYLKSMEASFVNQLYNSMDIPGWNSLKRNDVVSSRQIHRTRSGQFKVLRGGCWQKVKFERPQSQLNKARDAHSFLASPWIRHFKSECKPKNLALTNPPGIAGSKLVINLSGKKAVLCEAASSLEHIDPSHWCHNELVGSDEEVSDQNFIDEEFNGEKGSSIGGSKKVKTEIPESSCHDQVVPLPHSQAPSTENSP